MNDPTSAAPQDAASIHTESHEDVQGPGTKIKRRPRVDGKWEWVSAYNLDLKTLDRWLLTRFNGDYGLPDYDNAPKSKRRKGRVAVTEDYYRIILPQGLTNVSSTQRFGLGRFGVTIHSRLLTRFILGRTNGRRSTDYGNSPRRKGSRREIQTKRREVTRVSTATKRMPRRGTPTGASRMITLPLTRDRSTKTLRSP